MSEPTQTPTSAQSAFSVATPYRDVSCGELRANDVGREVRIAGWVHRRREHGGLTFIDLRDRYGLTQVVVNEAEAKKAAGQAAKVRNEFVLQVSGKVHHRLPGTTNSKLPTGEIEVLASDIKILSEANTPPFYINEPDAPVDESLRLRYRRWPPPFRIMSAKPSATRRGLRPRAIVMHCAFLPIRLRLPA